MQAMAEAKMATEADKWQSVYPLYINKAKSIAKGRRVSKEVACEKPTLREMCVVCQQLGLRILPQPLKRHPKDWETRGRLKVQLKDADGAPVHDEIHTKKQLLIKLATMIPTLKSRTDPAPVVKPKAPGSKPAGNNKKRRSKRRGRR